MLKLIHETSRMCLLIAPRHPADNHHAASDDCMLLAKHRNSVPEVQCAWVFDNHADRKPARVSGAPAAALYRELTTLMLGDLMLPGDLY